VTVAGNVCNSISNEIIYYLKHDATYKVILYSNTKSSAEGHLLALAKKTLSLNSVNCDTIPLTGDSSLMMKNWLVALFSGSIHSTGSNLQVLLATLAANCGISSTLSLLAICYGFPATLVDPLQEMGHVCWGPRVAGNLHDRYHVYLNCDLFLLLLLQIQQVPLAKECSIQLNNLMAVLQFLLLPTQCYHISLEAHFGNSSVNIACEPCHSKCLYCRGEHPQLTTTFCRASLISFLLMKVFILSPVPVAKLVKVLEDNKSKLFTTSVSKLNQVVIHSLVLQLLAAGILAIYVDGEKEETSHLSTSNFIVNWAIIDSDDDAVLAHTKSLLWLSFNYV
jgi:hypothetical protein